MQAAPVIPGYSEFFASGFKAATSRSQQHGLEDAPFEHSVAHRSASLDVQPPTATKTTAKYRRSFADITGRRRPASMFVSSTSTSNEAPSNIASTSRQPREKPSRVSRSSLVASVFSSRLFDRKPFADSSSSRTASSANGASGAGSRSAEDGSLPELWVTAGGPLTPSAPNGSSALYHGIDPFAAAPNAKSFFVDSWSISDSPPTSAAASLVVPATRSSSVGGTTKRESFISFTTSNSSNRSSSIFFVHRDRSDRPASVHTIPPPSNSQSRRSSLQFWPHPPSSQQQCGTPTSPSDKSESFFLIQEEEDNPCAQSMGATLAGNSQGQNSFLATPHPSTARAYESDIDWSTDDAPAKIDWRQFHTDILLTEDTQGNC